MFPYWLLFSFTSLGALEYRRSAWAREARPLLGLIGLVIILMIGFRYRVGADWYNYEEIYHSFHSLSLADAFQHSVEEPAFTTINWMSDQLGLSIWFVNLVCAAFFGWGLLRFVKAQPNPWLALVVATPYLIIVVAMGYTRQAVAIGLVMAGLANIGKAPLYRFAIYIAAAGLFHKSAVILLPIVALASSRNRLLTGLMLLSIAGMLYYYLVAGSMDRMMNTYIEAEYNSQGATIRVLMNVPAALIYLGFKKRFGLLPDEERAWRNIALASFVAVALLFVMSSSTAVDRLALYLLPLQLFVFSRLPYAFAPSPGRRNPQLTVAVIVYYGLIQFVWLNFAEHARFWVPYSVFPVGSDVPAISPRPDA